MLPGADFFASWISSRLWNWGYSEREIAATQDDAQNTWHMNSIVGERSIAASVARVVTVL
jgi:dolichyl-phosphate-mannose--protein O-mannosyl transferase